MRGRGIERLYQQCLFGTVDPGMDGSESDNIERMIEERGKVKL